jgi:hypothetical protein
MSLQSYVNKAADTSPPCGHVEEEDSFDEKEVLTS